MVKPANVAITTIILIQFNYNELNPLIGSAHFNPKSGYCRVYRISNLSGGDFLTVSGQHLRLSDHAAVSEISY